MTFEDAVKLNSAYEALKRERGSNMHSYLIVTPDTVTAELCARYMISFCTGIPLDSTYDNKDVYTLPMGEKVLTADSDFITETAYIMPSQLSKKYFIVRGAETANETAQNKLLKTLEEPPETAVIILLCANEYAMLPTVKSRCRIVRPSLYSDDVLRRVLDEEYPDCENPNFAMAVSGGSLYRLKTAAEKGTENFDFTLKMLTCMRKSSEILPYATQLIAKKDKLIDILDYMELIMRDCMVHHYRPELIKLKNNVMDIRELSRDFGPDAVLKELPIIARARGRINTGGNVNSIVDELLFSILEEKSKCQK